MISDLLRLLFQQAGSRAPRAVLGSLFQAETTAPATAPETGYASAAKQSTKPGFAAANATAGCFARLVERAGQLVEASARATAGKANFAVWSASKTSSG
ncbi:hypothetical protein D3Y59_11985 [Hymenobacter oligotrophus]|uniref:Uncharacterized protein n=1 Tax=Hymenobacter oligotrophus TaxID=2319843 RepID=A0A3B7R1Q3_9BACT|nr:hypothetical protein [Hymenobacter oligotrophus]AYA37702.1 hypothetical protein D3Y59_11985 [Hymenobacter oligotrophus]